MNTIAARIAFIAMTFPFLAAAETVLHVSPTGKDTNPGTEAAPFATLTKARDAIRAIKRKDGLPKGGVTVYLHGGKHVLNETFVLTPEDSGEAGSPVVYKSLGDPPAIVTSERTIEGWKPVTEDLPHMAKNAKGKLWVADVPKGWRFHYLTVDGKQREVCSGHRSIVAVGDPGPDGQLFTFRPGALQGVSGNGDVEMWYQPSHCWMHVISVLKNVDPDASTARRHSKNVAYRGKPGEHCRLLNAFPDFNDDPGVWCVDSAQGKVFYRPPGGNMDGVKALAPVLVNLVRLQGNEPNGPWVHHIEWRGVTFQYSDRLGEDEWPDSWLKRNFENPDAAIFCQGVEDVAIEGCRVLYAGTYAIALDHHAQRCRVVGNELGWLGCGGVQLYGYGPGTLDVNRDNLIHRNWIHDIGRAYWHSAGVTLYGSGHNRISLNFIQTVPYCGIAIVGPYSGDLNSAKRWSYHTDAYGKCEAQYNVRWKELPEGSEERYRSNTGTFNGRSIKAFVHSSNNLVEHNICEDVMLKLGDGGALYCWGCGTNNVWRRNAVRQKAKRFQDAFYMDDEVWGAIVQDNVLWGLGKASSKGQNQLINNTTSLERTPAYDALMKEITDLAKQEGGWLGNPVVPVRDPENLALARNGVVARASTEYSKEPDCAAKVIDGITDFNVKPVNRWHAEVKAALPQWIEIELPIAKMANSLVIHFAEVCHHPQDFRIVATVPGRKEPVELFNERDYLASDKSAGKFKGSFAPMNVKSVRLIITRTRTHLVPQICEFELHAPIE